MAHLTESAMPLDQRAGQAAAGTQLLPSGQFGGPAARFDGYLEFQRRPQPTLDWFAQYMS
jgi:hypothetical protein